jgi:hypothetical protein
MQTKSLILVGICVTVLAGCNETSIATQNSSKRGQLIYAKECSQCHGARGEGGGAESLGLGVVPPSLVVLRQSNDGYFPREFVSRFVMGALEKDDPNSPMPEFAREGLKHVYPKGGADGEVLEADFEDLLDYLESIQQ